MHKIVWVTLKLNLTRMCGARGLCHGVCVACALQGLDTRDGDRSITVLGGPDDGNKNEK